MKQHNDISSCIYAALETYFKNLDGEMPAPIYDMVIRSVERPMFEVIIRQSGGNQTQAAAMLGINRNTLRKKLVDYKLV